MRHRSSLVFSVALSALLIFSCAATSNAAAIGTESTLVILRVGDGSATLTGNAAPLFFEEYSIGFNGQGVPTSATHVQTIPVPSAGALGTKLTSGGTAAAEGGLNLSEDGQYIMFAGYDSALGTAVSGSSIPRRMAGRLSMAGAVSIDAIYGSGTTSSGNAIRSLASLDGNQYWFGMGGATTGIGYRTWEGGNNAGVNANILANGNFRRLEIVGNQLYADSAAGSLFGVATVGTGGPPTTGTQTVTVLPGMPTSTGPSPYDYFFADANTLYVADDRTFNSTTSAGSTNGGLQKWVFTDTNSDLTLDTWVLAYTKNIDTTNDTIDYGLRGLAGASVGIDGTVTLFATTTYGGNSTANFLVGISDTIGNTNPANVIVNTLASATLPGNVAGSTAFRGLETIGIVIPEPGSLMLLAFGSAMLIAARRR